MERLKLCAVTFEGFRGAQGKVNVEFGEQFTVLTGRNGTGKSSICDAIEYAITGELQRYSEFPTQRKKEAQEYYWWRGKGEAKERFVELTLTDEIGKNYHFKRDHRGKLTGISDQKLRDLILNATSNYDISLSQTLRATLIRDEQISELSLDLADRARFTFVSNVLGLYDISPYAKTLNRTERAAKKLLDEKKQKLKEADEVLYEKRIERSRLDGATVSPTAIAALNELKEILGNANLPNDQAVRSAQQAIIRLDGLMLNAESLLERLKGLEIKENESADDSAALSDLQEELDKQRGNLAALELEISKFDNPESAARFIQDLVSLGQELGLTDESKCPLCGSVVDEESFESHLRTTMGKAENLASTLERRIQTLNSIGEIEARLSEIEAIKRSILKSRSDLESDWQELLSNLANSDEPEQSNTALSQTRILDTSAFIESTKRSILALLPEIGDLGAPSLGFKVSEQIETLNAERARLVEDAEDYERFYEHLVDLRRSAQRLSGQFLDDRLVELDPLLTELYTRLRPHTSWEEIRTSVRGDVQHSLGLMVSAGEEIINPTYVFSSGQRRAAGLAFLVALGISNPWTKLNSVVFDDPVQHVDDYRALHLVETLAAIVKTGKQVICSVEDPALAKLMARRIPCETTNGGKIVEMGFDPLLGAQVSEIRTVRPPSSEILKAV